ncbi:MAG: transposase family protein [Clostridia bacterium]|nr:transposase family protein [Clostridia bacterium]
MYAETKKKPHVCPKCGSTTSKVHDYRTQKIKDIPIPVSYTHLTLPTSDLV